MSPISGETDSLWHALASVPDHRCNAATRYDLVSFPLIAVAAMLSGPWDQLGIIRWGRQLSREAFDAIGISRTRVGLCG